MNLFYAKPSDFIGDSVSISGQEAIHILRVLRHSQGDKITITDGEGVIYHCEIETVKKDRLTALIQSTETVERTLPLITLCMGVIKKRDRLEFALEKAVEIGADRVILFLGDNSERSKVRLDRLQVIARSAMKQSKGAYLTEVVLADSLMDAVSNPGNNKIIVADEQLDSSTEWETLRHDNYMLIVGPEGGFSDRERAYLNTVRAEKYSLGAKRLRAETAAILMVDRFKNV